jgi:hypothetical protein
MRAIEIEKLLMKPATHRILVGIGFTILVIFSTIALVSYWFGRA